MSNGFTDHTYSTTRASLGRHAHQIKTEHDILKDRLRQKLI